MADQASFDKPDGASNYNNEVWETVRGNIAAAGSMTPGARAAVPVGFLRRSTPAAKHLVIEFWTGSAWSTLYDSRDLGGGITINAPSSSTALTVNGAAGQFIAAFRTASGAAAVSISGPAGAARYLQIATAGSPRWLIEGNSAAESGGNAGTDLTFNRFSDAGSYISTALAISRATGGVTINSPSSGAALIVNAASSNAGVIINANGASWTGLQLSKGGTGKWFALTDNEGADMFSLYAIVTARSVLSATQAGNVTINAPSIGPALAVAADQHLTAAAPKLIHRTGGQDVSELAFTAASGRGNLSVTTRTTGGGTPYTAIAVGDAYAALFGRDTGLGAQVIANGTGVQLYPAGAGEIDCGAVTRPAFDNAYTLGKSGARWSAVWAANGTIQTSDARDKADVQPIEPAAAHRFLQLLAPVTFRWLLGGMRVEEVPDGFDQREVEIVEEVEELDLVPATEAVEVTETAEEVELVDGRAVLRQVERKRIEQRPLGQWVDVVDAAGQPVMQPTGERREVRRGRGRRIEPVLAPRRHFVPQLTQVTVKRQRKAQRIEQVPRFKRVAVDQAGQRFHAGFLAHDVRRALTEAGLDRAGQALGLWVSDDPADPQARQSLRPDQLLPFLVAAYRHQDARIAALEARAEAWG